MQNERKSNGVFNEQIYLVNKSNYINYFIQFIL